MDCLYLKGELIQIHLMNLDVVEGRFYSKSNDNSKISLYDLKELPNGHQCEGICHYYGSEVQNIVRVKESGEITHLKIPKNEVEDIVMMSKKYIFVNQIDKSFHAALDDLNQSATVGLSSDGATLGRKCKMPFLVMSTPLQIYIFDIQVMQYHAFDAGLTKLLESETPKKIVHNCRVLSDCLFHKHNVKLNSVFDTQVADNIITKFKNGVMPVKVKNLQTCLNLYLGLPHNDEKNDEVQLDLVQCNIRPLTTKIKETLAKNISFLHRLHEKVHQEIMFPYIKGFEHYLDSIRTCDDYKAWESSGTQDKTPKEFKNAIDY